MTSLLLPGDDLGVAPEIVQIVILPGVVAEEMDDHVDEIDDDPGFAFVAGAAEAFEAALLAEFDDLIGDGAHLAGAGAVGQDEIIGDRGEAGQIEDGDAMGAGGGGEARGVDGELARVAVAGGVGGILGGGRGDDSPPGNGGEV